MALELYQKVVEIIGYLPPQWEFLYGIGALIVFIGMLCIILFPIFLCLSLVGGK